jgi:hypothetical protein
LGFREKKENSLAHKLGIRSAIINPVFELIVSSCRSLPELDILFGRGC